MDIAPYIQELLAEKDQVSLPGFGLFMKRRLQGYYDGASGKLYPPTERLELLVNSNPSEELIDFIREKKHISAASASYFINQFVQALKTKLQNGEVIMPSIGTIRSNNDSYILSDTASLPFAGFGLDVLSDPVVSYPTKKTVQKQPIQLVDEAAFTGQKESNTPSYVYWLLILLIVFLSAGIAYYFHPEWFPFEALKNTPLKELAKKAPVKQVIPVEKPVDSVVNNDTGNTTKPAIAATKKAPPKTALAEVPQYEPQEYEIIGASFKTLKSAAEQVKRFGWKGVPAKILKNTPGKRIKISLGSFKDATSAQMELKRLKAELNNKELFIEPYKTK